MVDIQSVFGGPLGPDPAIALRPPAALPQPRTGPLHKVQYVVELVGPRSAPAAAAAALVGQQWSEALGRPEAFAMAPADSDWRPMTGSTAGSYDSIALCWDILSQRGELTSQAAQHLFQVAEQFAAQIQRRAMALPVPADVDKVRRQLVEIRDSLDVGFGMAVLARPGIPERNVWIACSRLGLDLGPTGEFEWRVAGWSFPLLSVSPLGPAAQFSLAGAAAGALHPAVSLGFNLPSNPAPADTLEACFKLAQTIAESCGGTVLDEEDRPLTDRTAASYRSNMKQAVQALERVGVPCGSAEALRLFMT